MEVIYFYSLCCENVVHSSKYNLKEEIVVKNEEVMATPPSNLNYKQLFKKLPRGIVLVNQHDHIIYANSRGAFLLDFAEAKNLIETPAHELDKSIELYAEQGKQISFGAIFSFERVKKIDRDDLFRIYFPRTKKERWLSIVSQRVEQEEGDFALFSIVDLTQQKKSEKALQFINQISVNLSRSTDYIQQLQHFANQIVPQFADWCVVDMLNNEGELQNVAMAHTDSTKLESVKRMRSKYPPDSTNKTVGVWGAIYQGKSDFQSVVTKDSLQKVIKVPAVRRHLLELGLRSLITVPLIARGKTMGAVTFVWSDSEKNFDAFDLEFFETVCQRVALIIDNARLLDQAQREIELQKEIQYLLIEKEMTLELALRAGNMGVWDWDLKTNQLRWSEGLERLHGLNRGEFQGTLKHFTQLVHSQDLKRVSTAIEKAIETKSNFEQEFRIVQPSKAIRWMIGKGRVFLDEKGNPGRMVGIGIDITERRIAEESLKQSEQKFKSVFETSMDGIVITDGTGKILDANDSAVALFHLTKASLITQHLSSLIDVQTEKDFEKQWAAIQKQGKSRGEFELRTDEGATYIEYQASAEIFPNQTLLMLRDITERKAEQQRQEHFLGIASHELKNPLASIKAFVQLLRRYLKHVEDEKAHQYLEKVDNKVDALAHLINDLLDITRIKQGKLEFFYEFFDLDQLIRDAIEDIRVTSKLHPIRYTGLPNTEVMADKNRISQVIQNIIRNAMKYSPEGETVKVSLKKNDNNLTVAIKDQGYGIPSSDLKKLFQLYYRGQNYKVNNITGLGVGLYISSQIVKQHGGKIWVKSTEGKGSTFYFTLPLRRF